MTITVREAKRTRTNLEEALESAAAFLGRQPGQEQLQATTSSAAVRIAAVQVEGKEADPAEPGTVSALADAVAVGQQVLALTDAGRKVPRLSARIEEAAALLG